MGKDEFLKLLSHQLRHQDPMNPMEQQKLTAELAQFSQLEQMTEMNAKMKQLGANAAMETKSMAAGFLGKRVYTVGNTIEHKGETTDVNFNLGKGARMVQVRLMDNKGGMIAEINKEGAFGRGPQKITWDGIQLDGHPAGKGAYNVVVRAWDEGFQEVKVEAKTAGVVDAVTFEDGQTVLTLNDGKKVLLRDVDRFESIEANINRAVPTKQALNNYAGQKGGG